PKKAKAAASDKASGKRKRVDYASDDEDSQNEAITFVDNTTADLDNDWPESAAIMNTGSSSKPWPPPGPLGYTLDEETTDDDSDTLQDWQICSKTSLPRRTKKARTSPKTNGVEHAKVIHDNEIIVLSDSD
ncbi:hypothetical protein H0H92_009641, partial [Tricholoma furcatifolium]